MRNLAQIQLKQSLTLFCSLKGKEQKESKTYCIKTLHHWQKRWQNEITPFGGIVWPTIHSNFKNSTSDTNSNGFSAEYFTEF